MKQIFITIFTLLCAASASFLDGFTPEHPLADNSTFSNIEQIATTHFHLDWNVDFDRQVISGVVTHDLEVVDST